MRKKIWEYEGEDEAIKALQSDLYPIEIKGHFTGCEPEFLRVIAASSMSEMIFGMYRSSDREKYYHMYREVTKKYPKIGREMCGTCGRKVYFGLTPNMKIVADSRCPYANGYPEIVQTLKVPSGEIVLFNILTKFYGGVTTGVSVNSTEGIAAYTHAYGKRGLVVHFVGNSCPGIYQPDRKTLLIGSPTKKVGKKCIGSICTDWWWYSAADRADLEKHAGKTVKQLQKEYHASGRWPKYVIAKVVPGVYKTTGRHHLCRESNRHPIYSTIEFVSEL